MKPHYRGRTCSKCTRPLLVIDGKCFVCGHPH